LCKRVSTAYIAIIILLGYRRQHNLNKKIDVKLLAEIFKTFFKIGCFTFGGGYAMIPLIEREVIVNKGWVKEEDIIDIFAVSESIPGAIAINSSTFIGYKLGGRKGAVSAALGVILPSFLIITLIAAFFSRFQDYAVVKAMFMGVRSAVVGLIVMAAIKIGKVVIKDFISASITILTVILVFIFKINAIIAIIGGAAIGAMIFLLFPQKMKNITERGGKNIDIS